MIMSPDAANLQSIYVPNENKPMNIAVFASGGGGNLRAVMGVAESFPAQARVHLVVTDRLGIPAIDIAKAGGIPVIARDFERECGVWRECREDPERVARYHIAAERFHDSVLEQIINQEEKSHERIDLIVLSYHRWIRGKLLRHFEGRMINQHPADLTVMDADQPLQRKYIGISPVFLALKDGQTQTRTCNFLVRDGQDNGEILCAGPWVSYEGTYPVTKQSAQEHELKQKERSDWPCLHFVIKAISEGRYAIHKTFKHPDGCCMVALDGEPLSYGGVDLSADF